MIMPIKLHATSNASSTVVDSLSSLAEEMEHTVYTLRLDEGRGWPRGGSATSRDYH